MVNDLDRNQKIKVLELVAAGMPVETAIDFMTWPQPLVLIDGKAVNATGRTEHEIKNHLADCERYGIETIRVNYNDPLTRDNIDEPGEQAEISASDSDLLLISTEIPEKIDRAPQATKQAQEATIEPPAPRASDWIGGDEAETSGIPRGYRRPAASFRLPI